MRSSPPLVKSAIADNRIDIYLQPMVTLPQRRCACTRAMTRLRDDKDQVITADEFIGPAEAAGLMQPDRPHRCCWRRRRCCAASMVRNKDVGGVLQHGWRDPVECRDLLRNWHRLPRSAIARLALRPSCWNSSRTCPQSSARSRASISPPSPSALAPLLHRSTSTDLRIEPRDLADRGVRFIKVPAALLLDPRQTSNSDIHPADPPTCSAGSNRPDRRANRGRTGRGRPARLRRPVRAAASCSAAPRPLRPETRRPTAVRQILPPRTPQGRPRTPMGPARSVLNPTPARPEPPRTTGNAALARRATGPNRSALNSTTTLRFRRALARPHRTMSMPSSATSGASSITAPRSRSRSLRGALAYVSRQWRHGDR